MSDSDPYGKVELPFVSHTLHSLILSTHSVTGDFLSTYGVCGTTLGENFLLIRLWGEMLSSTVYNKQLIEDILFPYKTFPSNIRNI